MAAKLDAFFMVARDEVRYHLWDMERSTHPYRGLPVIAAGASKPVYEELVLYALLVAIGAIPVVLALVDGGTFGVEATIGLLMVSAGLLGALAYLWRAALRDRDQ